MDFEAYHKISWYPGHMLKAERELKEKLKLIDIAVILCDARAPLSSRNHQLETIFQNKAKLIILSKSDLADENQVAEWKHYFRAKGEGCISMHHKQQKILQKIPQLILDTATKYRKDVQGATTPLLRPIRAMIIGQPNVGKSSLINALIKKKRTQTGPRPGVTRHQQWVKLNDKLELMDTPGIMIPSIKTVETGLKLALIESLKDSIPGRDLLCEYLLHLTKQDIGLSLEHYRLKSIPQNAAEFIEEIGQKFGYLKQENEVIIDQASKRILQDYREGLIGKACIETAVHEDPE
ncbi:MAG: ribosome biogenesis GTPase YlqF [Lentisphaeria bacterium]|nr:ribosome biogenesis GTPase YlqF [Lentisphaeria bacterium]NQZ68518.1 ribosome biogenesis GTPase YlqF [Lentisphaeria bacterium]